MRRVNTPSLCVTLSLLCRIVVSVPSAVYGGAVEGAWLSLESVPLLERVAAELTANQERIRTWRGTVERTMEVREEVSLKETFKWSIRFAYDREKDWRLSVAKQTKAIKGGEKLPQRIQAFMLTDNAYYSYGSYTPETFPERFLPILSISAASEGRMKTMSRDPEDFRALSMLTPGLDAASFFAGYAKLAKEGQKLGHVTVSQKGTLVTLGNRAGEVVNVYVVDLARGCSLVEFVMKGSEPSNVWKCEVQNVSGVWIPKVITEETVRGARQTLDRTRWLDQVVNKPISKDEFTIANLGVCRGDRVQDQRTGAAYELFDDLLPPRETPKTAVWRLVGVSGSLLLVAVAGYLVVRRSRRRSGGA